MNDRMNEIGFTSRRRKPVAVAIALAVGILVVAAHLHVRSQGLRYAGGLLILEHVFDIALATALLTLCYGVGARVLYLARLAPELPLEKGLSSTLVGAGIVSAALLICGLFTLEAWSVTLLMAAAAAFGRQEIARLPQQFRQTVRYVRALELDRVYVTVAVVVLALVVLHLMIHATAPPGDWDSLMYHLEAPRQFLAEGRVHLPEDNLHVAFVGLVQMLYVPLLAFGSSSGPATLNALFALILAVAVFSFSVRYLDPSSGVLASALIWGSTTIPFVAVTARVDVTLALYVFMGHYMVLAAISNRRAHPYLYLAGLILGFALGIKYHALVYAAVLTPLVLWVVYLSSKRLRSTPFRPLLVFSLLFLVASIPWLLKNWVLLGSPLYPFFTERILQPWLATLYGHQGLPAQVNPEIFELIASARAPFNFVDLLFAPTQLTVESEGRFYRLNPLLLLLPLWFLFWKNRTLHLLAIPALAFLILATAPFEYTNLRYLIAGLPALTVVVAHVVVRLSHRFLSIGAARLLVSGVLVVGLAPAGRALYQKTTGSPALSHAIGITSAGEYLRAETGYLTRMTEAVNARVPDDGKVLMLMEARGYYFDRKVIQDNTLTNWPLLAPLASQGNCLRDVDVTHVLVGSGVLRYYVLRGMEPAPLRLNLFPKFSRACLRQIHQGNGFYLYEIRKWTTSRRGQAPAVTSPIETRSGRR